MAHLCPVSSYLETNIDSSHDIEAALFKQTDLRIILSCTFYRILSIVHINGYTETLNLKSLFILF